MPDDSSGVDDLASSLHRNVPGSLLGIVAIVSVGLAMRRPKGIT